MSHLTSTSDFEKRNNFISKKLSEVDAGNQQLLEKLLGIEEDLDGKFKGLNESAKEIKTQVSFLEEHRHTSSSQILSIQNSISKQSEAFTKYSAESTKALLNNVEEKAKYLENDYHEKIIAVEERVSKKF